MEPSDDARPGEEVMGDLIMFVCPDCKSPMQDFYCQHCQSKFPLRDGFPVLLPLGEKFRDAVKIGDAYDDIYTRHTNVWNDQGRTPEFIGYFADLLKPFSTARLLEIGCGEGFLLAAVRAPEKVAIDISVEALRKARSRARADFSVALAERLPFPDASFDMVVSVGVMEHFLDDEEATREIYRVLRPSGHYVVLIHANLSTAQSIALKFSEYVFPRFRPFALVRWLYGKLTRSVIQPIQRRYTLQTARARLETIGLRVSRIITKRSDPLAPLSGPHVVILFSQKVLVASERLAEDRFQESSNMRILS